MAMDRKRRLTGSTQEGGRLRTMQGGFHDRSFSGQSLRLDGPSSPRRTHSRTDAPREVVDLTGSSPPGPSAGQQQLYRSRTPSNSSRHYVVPRWQPDSEVSECSICHRPFTWMFRRHHCRKCGRVVCNDCSPHRITIPRQFIVNPPGAEMASSATWHGPRRAEIVDLTGDEDERDRTLSASPNNPAIGGGEKVRLCNPCVPDPQPISPPNYSLPVLPARSTSGLFPNSNASSLPLTATLPAPSAHAGMHRTQPRAARQQQIFDNLVSRPPSSKRVLEVCTLTKPTGLPGIEKLGSYAPTHE